MARVGDLIQPYPAPAIAEFDPPGAGGPSKVDKESRVSIYSLQPTVPGEMRLANS
jgi:hypothetical protein